MDIQWRGDIQWHGEAKQAAKQLFGRPLRIALAAWILLQDEPFYLLQAQDAMRNVGEVSSNVAIELKSFAAHGMVNSVQDGRRLYYVRTPSPYWTPFEAAAVALGLLVSEAPPIDSTP